MFGLKPHKRPNIRFGRYNFSHLPKDRVKIWNESDEAFRNKKYLDAYERFFRYIYNEEEDNVRFTRKKNTEGKEIIEFYFYQGSKKISGYVTNDKICIEVQVVKLEKTLIPILRLLLDMNYSLNYSKFALKDGIVFMKFTSSTVDCSPWKLYASLRELSQKADGVDDMLLDKFTSITPLDSNHIEELPANEKKIKVEYLKKWMEEAIKVGETLEEPRLSGGILYHFMDTAFKIYYLIGPEGVLLSDFEEVFKLYYGSEDKNLEDKSNILRKEFKKIMEKEVPKIERDLYKVKFTFGHLQPTGHKEVKDFIEYQYENHLWYKDNNYPEIVRAIFEYIAGYVLSSFGTQKPTEKLLHLIFNVLNQEYFLELGFDEVYYDIKNKKINKKLVEKRIIEILQQYREQYPELVFDLRGLDYEDLNTFAGSMLLGIARLNYLT